MRRRSGGLLGRRCLFIGCVAVSLAASALAGSQGEAARLPWRVVLLKFDGLPFHLVDDNIDRLDSRTARRWMPWTRHVFYENGVRFPHFFTRGLSISAPAWCILDTGRPPAIRFSVEFDRATGAVEDYLNFATFYWDMLRRQRIYPRPVEVLDELGVPLFSDVFPAERTYSSIQLFQRSLRWMVLANVARRQFFHASPREYLYQAAGGMGFKNAFFEANEREFLYEIEHSGKQYLDFFSAMADKNLHNDNGPGAARHVVEELDQVVGRTFEAIQKSGISDRTILVLVSDHGMNTRSDRFSQGFNLVRLLGLPQGGAHHVLTKRRTLSNYSLKILVRPLATSVVNRSQAGGYLKDKPEYVTAMLDLDGNERASLHLRSSHLNRLHLVLLQLQKKIRTRRSPSSLAEELRVLQNGLEAKVGRQLVELEEELGNLSETLSSLKEARDLTPAQKFQRDRFESYREAYEAYRQALSGLLRARPEEVADGKVSVRQLLPPGIFGPSNGIHELQEYVVDVDMEGRYRTLDYFQFLAGQRVRNTRGGVESKPVDFVATRVPVEQALPALQAAGLGADEDPVWLYASPESQALILAQSFSGETRLRYVPVAQLRQDSSGAISFRRIPFQPGLPLRIWEDPDLGVTGRREEWLGQFHGEEEWRWALYRTRYSLGILGLYEACQRPRTLPGISPALARFFRRRQLHMDPDLQIFAADGWNFDVKDFNPGGNHGGFFQASARATLMIWGGERTGLRRGVSIEKPYDSLSFLPTLVDILRPLDGGSEMMRRLSAVPWAGQSAREVLQAELAQAPP
ncbi:MAG: alkaline phosphatase family protein [Acidobacteria bacterium]|nr:alkaline phosphatase family protein [Acidobacteriota bacterium]